MKYVLKITRDLDTNVVVVHPVTRARSTVKPYRIVYNAALRYAENLRTFNTRKEAETAFAEEQIAAEFSPKTSQELMAILRADLATLKKAGFSAELVCRLTEIGSDCLRAYISRGNPPNPRIVAKVHLLIPLISEFRDRVWSVLPLQEDIGGRKRPFPRAKKYL